MLKLVIWKQLSKHIYWILGRVNLFHDNFTNSNNISDKVMFHINVFGLVMITTILGQMNSILAITKYNKNISC